MGVSEGWSKAMSDNTFHLIAFGIIMALPVSLLILATIYRKNLGSFHRSTTAPQYIIELWQQDDSPVLSFSECLICKEEGYPGQRGHSTQSCLADRIRDNEI